MTATEPHLDRTTAKQQLDQMVKQTANYFREREEAILAISNWLQ